jgi:hypothetical protein
VVGTDGDIAFDSRLSTTTEGPDGDFAIDNAASRADGAAAEPKAGKSAKGSIAADGDSQDRVVSSAPEPKAAKAAKDAATGDLADTADRLDTDATTMVPGPKKQKLASVRGISLGSTKVQPSTVVAIVGCVLVVAAAVGMAVKRRFNQHGWAILQNTRDETLENEFETVVETDKLLTCSPTAQSYSRASFTGVSLG